MGFFTSFTFVTLCQFYFTTSPVLFTKLHYESIGKNIFLHIWLLQHITEVENHIFKTIEFLDISAFINNPHWHSSGNLIFFVQILYSYFRYTGRLFLGCALFVAGCNTIRTSWETKKERLSYRKKYIKEFVWGISFFWIHALLSMSLSCFLCLLPLPSQAMQLWNGSYEDTYIAMGDILCDDMMSKRSKIWKSII